MNVRSAMTAVAALMSATVALAEPTKTPGDSTAPAASHPAQVVLASADQVPAGASNDQSAPTPVKHRAARVTTCRCGDQVADPSEASPDQE